MDVIVIGTGSIGERHVRCFQQTGRARVTIVEPNDQLRTSVAERYHVQAFPSLDTVLASSGKFNAGVIATPAQLHVPLALQLAGRGMHLLIEKPLSTHLGDVNKLMQIVTDKQLVAMVAYVYRCFPALAAMRQAIIDGRFGKPLQLVAVCGQNFPTYRPAYRETYYTQHATGGGAIQDALTHIINAGQWLVGPIDSLVADAAHLALPDVEVEDTVHVLARHGEVLGCYSLNQHQAPNETSISVICQRGTACFETHLGRWKYMQVPDEPWHTEPAEPAPRDAAFIAQANAFIDAVELGAEPTCTLDEGLHTLAVNLAILTSISNRSWQTLAGRNS